MKQNRNEYIVLEKLGEKVKSLIEKDRSECQELVVQALVNYPHAPQPQNLLGILAEKQGDLALAMKHWLFSTSTKGAEASAACSRHDFTATGRTMEQNAKKMVNQHLCNA